LLGDSKVLCCRCCIYRTQACGGKTQRLGASLLVRVGVRKGDVICAWS
jgi:hypothetical protein